MFAYRELDINGSVGHGLGDERPNFHLGPSRRVETTYSSSAIVFLRARSNGNNKVAQYFVSCVTIDIYSSLPTRIIQTRWGWARYRTKRFDHKARRREGDRAEITPKSSFEEKTGMLMRFPCPAKERDPP